MKVLMLGWEFPPFFAGGVGIVCYELTKKLSEYQDLEIEYVMAYGPERKTFTKNFNLTAANKPIKKSNISITKINTTLYNYDSSFEYSKRFAKILESQSNSERFKSIKQIYGENLLQEVELYAQRILAHYEDEEFDVIHAHDWTTVPAAILLKEKTGKPFIFHVHITELDKTGGTGGCSNVFEIEKLGFENADKIVCVSNFTKNRLIFDYGINPEKIIVIHNGGISDLEPAMDQGSHILPNSKMILFAGRMTLQKGPEYFLKAAQKVLEYEPNTIFVMIGNGDMLSQMIELAVNLGIGRSVFFHGTYSREEANEFFNRADVFVMPSVSEPFGIVPIEAIVKGTPTIISKQSGISEVLTNVFKIDFWDTDEIAHRILALLRYPNLHSHMKNLAFDEIAKFDWDKPAREIRDVYQSLIN